eukprot:CAMPEP_0174819084 /NCGR_PEP_ID=MMETSP1107-20130205/2100_1 /TAXON_ID=36770 /ORGANISM="Paraphysomonas vestita, Strain GFlagA" /LENGTH=186 /DNA_ID=CAMNT_0016031923 /DNA_START=1729 /DNA_END=2290 /DNA_ORIENTATION=+
MTPSPDLPYPPLLPSNLDGTNDNFEETSPNKLNDFNIQLSSENTPTDDTIGNSTWSPSKLSSTSGNKESQLESLFASNRQDIERSVSLGGLGWMPSSLSTHNHPPPQSRRGFSDLGVGIGFGNDNTDRDVSFGFNLPDLVETIINNNYNSNNSNNNNFNIINNNRYINTNNINIIFNNNNSNNNNN